MNIVLVSKDKKLESMILKLELIKEHTLSILKNNLNPLDLVSSILTFHPRLIILDDDCVKPDSFTIIEFLKKIKHNIFIFFITSDPDIELGKKICQLGVNVYMYKPLEPFEIKESLQSIINVINKGNMYN